MKSLAIASIALMTFFGVAYGGASEGKPLFASKCAPCHGPNGEGRAAIAKMFNVTMRPLGSKEVQAQSDAELKQRITKGQGKMKPVGGVTDKQVDDIIAFVRTLKQ